MKNSSTLRIVVVSWLWVLCLVIKDGCALELNQCGAHLEPNKGVVGSTVSIINRSTDCKIIADEEYRCGFKFEDAKITIVGPAIVTPKKISCIAPPSPKTLPTNVEVSFGPGSNFNATTWYGIYGYFTYTVTPPTVEPTSSTPTITQPPTVSIPTTTPSISNTPSSQPSKKPDAPSFEPFSQPSVSNAPSNYPSSTPFNHPSITPSISNLPSPLGHMRLIKDRYKKCCCNKIRSDGTCVAEDTIIAICNIEEMDYKGYPIGKECNSIDTELPYYSTECIVRKDCNTISDILQRISSWIFIILGFGSLIIGFKLNHYKIEEVDKSVVQPGFHDLSHNGFTFLYFGFYMIDLEELATISLVVWFCVRLYTLIIFIKLMKVEKRSCKRWDSPEGPPDGTNEDEKYKHEAKSIYQRFDVKPFRHFLTFSIQMILLVLYTVEVLQKDIHLNRLTTFGFLIIGIIVQYVFQHKKNIEIDESIAFWHHEYMIFKETDDDPTQAEDYIFIGDKVKELGEKKDAYRFYFRFFCSVVINHVYYYIIVIFLPFQLCTFQDPISFATGAAGAYFMVQIDDCPAEEVGSPHDKLIKNTRSSYVAYSWLKQKFKSEVTADLMVQIDDYPARIN